jgi:hypothetical protein
MGGIHKLNELKLRREDFPRMWGRLVRGQSHQVGIFDSQTI